MKKILITLMCLFLPDFSLAKEVTTVTTYITTTQDQRESTRFTLTEWLRIKERMKMMDVWLAMFSEPAKDRFSPELALFYGQNQALTQCSGLQNISPPLSAEQEATFTNRKQDSNVLWGQLWLTNVISSTFGVRTLNIDLGFETYRQQSTLKIPDLNSLGVSFDPSIDLSAITTVESKRSLRYNSLNLRLFGKNIQDSSLVFKYGEYTSDRELSSLFNKASAQYFSQTMMGAELQLYLFRWLGIEASALSLGEAKKDSNTMKGSILSYGPYLEVSLLRFMAGIWTEDWTYGDGTSEIQESSKGAYAGVKLQL